MNILLLTKMKKIVRPSCIMLLKMVGYRRDLDETKHIKNDTLPEKYDKIWSGQQYMTK